MCQVPKYSAAIDAWFAPVRNHPMIGVAKRARSTARMGFDGVMSLAIYLDSATQPAFRQNADTSALEPRWRILNTKAFLDTLRQFVDASRFKEFLESQRPLYTAAEERLKEFAQRNLDIPWYSAYFKVQTRDQFIITTGLCNGGGNYGPHYVNTQGDSELYAILGAFADSTGVPSYTRAWLPTLIHEFNHSFVNREMERQQALFAGALPALYQSRASAMRSQAYSNWLTMLNESIVRAAVTRYLVAHGDSLGMLNEIADQIDNGFSWGAELSDLLAQYEASPTTYKTFAAFVPRIAEYFATVPQRLEQLTQAFDAQRPHIVSTFPVNGAENVDPATTSLTIVFDRPMRSGYSLNRSSTPGRAFPDRPPGTRPSFDSTTTTFNLPVSLQPGITYELFIMPTGFRSRSGHPVRLTTFRFTTASRSPQVVGRANR